MKTRYLVKFNGETLNNALKNSRGIDKLFETPELAIVYAIKEGFSLDAIKVMCIQISEVKNIKSLIFK